MIGLEILVASVDEVPHAAHGLVGSSNAIISKVARLLPELLMVGEHPEKIAPLLSKLL